MTPILEARLTCPKCAATSRHPIPEHACQFFLACPSCQQVLRPLPGDCCVFCSYADVRCPSRAAREADTADGLVPPNDACCR